MIFCYWSTSKMMFTSIRYCCLLFKAVQILPTSCPCCLAWLVNGSGDSLLGAVAGTGGLFTPWGLGGGPEGPSKNPSSEYGLHLPGTTKTH